MPAVLGSSTTELTGMSGRLLLIFVQVWPAFVVLKICPGVVGVPSSGKDGVDDFPVDVGEPAVDAVVVEGELFVVDAEQVEDGGVEVGDGDLVFGDEVTDVIGGAVGDALAEAGAREEAGEGLGMMVSPGRAGF